MLRVWLRAGLGGSIRDAEEFDDLSEGTMDPWDPESYWLARIVPNFCTQSSSPTY